MRILRRMMFVAAIAATGVSCERRPQPVDSGTDDAKLRPEVAVASKGGSPSPFEQGRVSPTPPPSPSFD
jgi:hypothetical protein